MNETFIVVSIVVLALIVIIAIAAAAGVAIWTNRKLREDPDFATLQEKHPEGYWMSIGMTIGVALGFPLGLPIGFAMDNIAIGTALGPGMGVAIGVAIGAALEQRHKGEIRPLTSYERRARQWTARGGIALLVFLAAAAVVGVVAMLLR